MAKVETSWDESRIHSWIGRASIENLVLFGELAMEKNTRCLAPKLCRWVHHEVVQEIERRERMKAGSPPPMGLVDWSNEEIAAGLIGCLLFARCAMSEDVAEVVGWLVEVVGGNAAVRLIEASYIEAALSK